MFSKYSCPLVVIVSLLLCACGGGEPGDAKSTETASAPAPEAPAPAAADKPDYKAMSIESLQSLIADQPEELDALHALGIALHQAGRVEEALPYFEKCAELRPSERHWVELGAVYFLLGRPDDAEPLFYKALEESPRSGPALFHLGNIAHSKGETDQAISLYSQAVEAEENYLIANYRLAEVYRETGQATQAYGAYEAVLACEPGAPADVVLFDRSMLQMSALDIQHGSPERATKLLELLITEYPRHPQAHYLMAQAWNAMGRAEDAQREMALHAEIAGPDGTPPTR